MVNLQVGGNPAFAYVSRRNQVQASLTTTATPACILTKHHEEYERQSPALPPRRTMTVTAFIYYNTGTDQNAISDTIINNIMDALDAAILPDTVPGQICRPPRFTLGGLVFRMIQWRGSSTAPGDRAGIGVAHHRGHKLPENKQVAAAYRARQLSNGRYGVYIKRFGASSISFRLLDPRGNRTPYSAPTHEVETQS